ncbi:ATP-binding protein [Acidisoma sp. C75]
MGTTTPEGPQDFRRRIAPTEAEVGALIDEVHAFADEAGLEPGQAYRIALAAEELTVNILTHSTGVQDIALSIRPVATGWQLTVEDDGAPFDPLSRPPADTESALEERAVGGLGLHLILQFANALDYQRAGGHNRLTAVFATGPRPKE